LDGLETRTESNSQIETERHPFPERLGSRRVPLQVVGQYMVADGANALDVHFGLFFAMVDH
jgi:hypothetical protein